MLEYDNSIFAYNLKKLMQEKGIGQRELARQLGISATTVSGWCNGLKVPRMGKIETLAAFFHVEKSDLIEPQTEKRQEKGVKIPVLGYVRAGIPVEAVEEILDYEEIPESMAMRGDFFGLKVKGDSMEPRICAGDVVIVRKQPDVESGEIAVVLVNGDEATVKRLMKQANGILLQAFNPVYPPLFFSTEDIEEKPVSVVGKVVELRGKFE